MSASKRAREQARERERGLLTEREKRVEDGRGDGPREIEKCLHAPSRG